LTEFLSQSLWLLRWWQHMLPKHWCSHTAYNTATFKHPEHYNLNICHCGNLNIIGIKIIQLHNHMLLVTCIKRT
jgi:hypothetical protein